MSEASELFPSRRLSETASVSRAMDTDAIAGQGRIPLCLRHNREILSLHVSTKALCPVALVDVE